MNHVKMQCACGHKFIMSWPKYHEGAWFCPECHAKTVAPILEAEDEAKKEEKETVALRRLLGRL